MTRFTKAFAVFSMVAIQAVFGRPAAAQDVKLLNVSYDPTRELYEELNQAFSDSYKVQTGKTIAIEQSHGGSGKQAHAVLDGLKADVVTLALGYDILALQKGGLIKDDWQTRLPENAAPYTSTVVLIVRKGNPKNIKDWNDLIRPDVQVITANPKTSGGARWSFLAAYGYGAGLTGSLNPTHAAAGGAAPAADKQSPALDEAKGNAFISALFKNVPVLDTGARGATVTFAQKGIGDVLINWENEAWLVKQEFGKDKFDTIYPSVSILAETPVAVVDKNVDAKGTRAAAEAYLKYLYTPEAQEIIGNQHYRPRNPDALKKFAADLPPIKLFTIDEAFGGWEKAQAKYFGDGGVFDQIYTKK